MTDQVPSKDEVWSDARVRDELRDYDLCLTPERVEQIFRQALRLIERPAHEREPPHCSNCSCHMPPPTPPIDLCKQLRALTAGNRLLGYTAAELIERQQSIIRGKTFVTESAPEPEPTHFAFLIKRPRDKEAWPTIFASREGAEGYEYRASEVVPVRLAQPPRGGQ